MRKRNIIPAISIFLTAALAVSGCKENERMKYTAPAAVYFSETAADDSLQYSFASGLKERDTVAVPIMIIGEKTAYDRHIQVETDAASTAQKDVHYILPQETVVLPGNEVKTALNVVVLDKDPSLEHGNVDLILHLRANNDFTLGYPERLSVRLIITKQLVKPKYWDMPLSLYYGSYTKAKHRLCIQIQGFDFPEEFDMDKVGDYISYGRMVYNSLLKTPLWDEETQTTVTADWLPL